MRRGTRLFVGEEYALPLISLRWDVRGTAWDRDPTMHSIRSHSDGADFALAVFTALVNASLVRAARLARANVMVRAGGQTEELPRNPGMSRVVGQLAGPLRCLFSDRAGPVPRP